MDRIGEKSLCVPEDIDLGECPLLRDWGEFSGLEENSARMRAFVSRFVCVFETEANSFEKGDLRFLIALGRIFFASINGVVAIPAYLEEGELGVTGGKNDILLKSASVLEGSGIAVKSVRASDNRNKNGYCMSFDESVVADNSGSVSFDEELAKILAIYERLLKKFEAGPDLKEGRFSLEEAVKKEIASVIKDISAQVKKILSDRRFDKCNKTVLKILLDGTKQGVAVLPENFNFCADNLTHDIGQRVTVLRHALLRSERYNIQLEAQKYPWNRRIVGYYLGVKPDVAEDDGREIALSPPIESVKPDDSAILVSLIDNVIINTPLTHESSLGVYRALRAATLAPGGASIVPGYCLWMQKNMISGYREEKKTFPSIRAINEALPRIVGEAEKFGFRIIERDGKFQAVLPADRSQDEMFKNAVKEIESRRFSRRKKTLLRTRMKDGMRHVLNGVEARDKKALKTAYKIIMEAVFDGRYLSVTEVFFELKNRGYNVVWDTLYGWIRKVERINAQYPDILGFDLREVGVQRYGFVLRDEYRRAEACVYRDFSPYPVKIDGGTKFTREVFDRVLSEWKKTSAPKGDAENPVVLRIFEIIAEYSVKGEAISITFIKALLGTDSDISGAFAYVKRYIKKREAKFGIVMRECTGRAMYFDLKNGDDVGSANDRLQVPDEQGSIELVSEPRRQWYTYPGKETGIDPYKGLVGRKFLLISNHYSGGPIFKRYKASLRVCSGEVLVALDGNMSRITKVRRKWIVPCDANGVCEETCLRVNGAVGFDGDDEGGEVTESSGSGDEWDELSRLLENDAEEDRAFRAYLKAFGRNGNGGRNGVKP